MPFLYEVGATLAHRGATGTNPERLFVVFRHFDPSPPYAGAEGANIYRIRQVTPDSTRQTMASELVTTYEHELMPYPV